MPDEPVEVLGDAARLHQVIVNLVTNARTHTPEGTRITVGLARATDGVDLTVRDTGQGIDPEFLPKLFERFARADSSRSRTVGSTGLGLAIVDAVVQAHGGRVEVTSEPVTPCSRCTCRSRRRRPARWARPRTPPTGRRRPTPLPRPPDGREARCGSAPCLPSVVW